MKHFLLLLLFLPLLLFSQDENAKANESENEQAQIQAKEPAENEKQNPKDTTIILTADKIVITKEDSTTMEAVDPLDEYLLFSIGGTFDFKDKLHANSLYADLKFETNSKAFFPLENIDGLSLGTFGAGIYHLETVTHSGKLYEDTFRYEVYTQSGKQYQTAYVNSTHNQSIRNLGMYCDLGLLNITRFSDKQKKQYGVNLKLNLHLEYIFSEVQNSFENEINTEMDSAIPTHWPADYKLSGPLPDQEYTTNRYMHSFYYGLSLKALYYSKYGIVTFEGGLGLTNNYHQEDETIALTSPSSYYVKVSYQKFPFKIGAELRGFHIPETIFENGQTGEIRKRMPYFSIYVATVLPFNALGRLYKTE